ncbi:acyltransferase family protein [Frisingicoccus sp.]|uniref:acyltransferase family protein n=1 Tax=Frisingicoccus sp. TaxID=1918627 RepID=UPI003AB16C9D
MNNKFTKENTTCLKGVAVLCLFVHHLLNAKYPFTSILVGDTYDYLSPVVSIGKVCVYMFFILSGYGLYISFDKEKHSIGNTIKFVFRHILKLYGMFWIIYIIFVPMGYFFGRNPSVVYGGKFIDAVFDFFGIAYLCGKTSCIATWWYLGMSILFYIFFPAVYWIVKKTNYCSIFIWGGLAALATRHVGWKISLIYSIPFILGIVFAHFNGFVVVKSLLSESGMKKAIKLILYVTIIGAFCVFRVKVMSQDRFFYRLDWILALPCLCAVYEYLPLQTIAAKVLQLIDKNSGNIYFFHAFIYSLYFKNIFYSLKYAFVIYVVTLAVCVGISETLEWIKKRIGYQWLIDKMAFYLMPEE